jgi:hypothetical protein
MRHVLFPLATLSLLVASPSLADEVWFSDLGQITYQADEGEIAILSFDSTDYGHGTIYVVGLGGNVDHRGRHEGYWIGEEQGDCDAELTGPDGTSSDTWGRVVVEFEQPGFPSAFSISLGECFGEPMDAYYASPNTGSGSPQDPTGRTGRG